MLLILPPSETKRDGGDTGKTLDLTTLGFPELTRSRKQVMVALRALVRNLGAAAAGLKISQSQRFEIDRDRTLATSPVRPALERYTGVLYDGLDATTLSTSGRGFADEHVLIHSALFGLLRAGDRIPAYRLSHDSRLPGISLRKHWRAPIAATLGMQSGLMLDLRSESYAELGPAPSGSWFVRVVAEGAGGRRTALTHFNKKGKGEFVRAVIASGVVHESVDSLLTWAKTSGIRLERGAPGELQLVVRPS